MDKYPECDRLAKVSDASQAIGEFIDWLREHDKDICQWQDGITDATRIADAFAASHGKGDPDIDEKPERGWFPIHTPIEKLLVEYFNIDLDKVEKERRQMLEECRRAIE